MTSGSLGAMILLPHERLPRRSSHHAPARAIKLPQNSHCNSSPVPSGFNKNRWLPHHQIRQPPAKIRRSQIPGHCTSLPEFCGLLSLVSLNAEDAATQRVRCTAFRGCGLRHQTQNGYRAGTRGPHHTPGSPRGKAAGRCPRRIQRQYRRNPRRSWGQHPNQERARR